MVFKVQDGIEFATRQDWRDYMMKTYYSFHDLRTGSPYVKPPGSIDGQGFDIINCEGVLLVVMDNTEQIQVDNCRNCRIFLGASASTIFVRNCENCTIYAACKQLRIRECFQCDIYSYSKGEIHIEMSNGLRFGPFNGGYPEQLQHLKSAGLLPVQNQWYSIYDHNAEKGEPAHWRLLKEHEYEEAWFPTGAECDVAVPLSAPVTTSSASSPSQGQVGASFSLEQMRKDAEKAAITPAAFSGSGKGNLGLTASSTVSVTEHEVVPGQEDEEENDKKVNQLGIETALLVASARAKGIDVSVWLSESADFAIVPAPDFNSRFISLGLAVGIQEDWETKRELDLATSAASLSTILAVCGAGFNEEGVPLLNVHSFLCMCEESVERYLQMASGSEASSPGVGGDLVASSTITTLVSVKQMEEVVHTEISVVQEGVESDSVANPSGEEETKNGHSTSFDTDAVVLKAKPSPGPEPHTNVRGRSTGSGMSDRQGGRQGRVRSTSEPPARRGRRSRGSEVVTSSIQKFYIDGNAADGTGYNHMSAVENLISQTVKQTDLYHKIQVHLGYLEAYTMTPARGKIVVSNPREWITAQEVKEAFCAARLHLSMPQIALLLNLIKEFATQSGETGPCVRISVADKKEMNSLNTALIASSVVLRQHKVHSEWLRKYLVHLRVGNGARPWAAWVNKKVKSNSFRKKTEDDMAIEFRKALGGLAHDLNDDEVKVMVKKFDILPTQKLELIIKNKVDSWVLDMDGRRDFTHLRNINHKKWLKKNKEVLSSISGAKSRKEKEKEALITIRRDMISQKMAFYRTDEKRNASITLEVFEAYQEDNRKKEFSFCSKFGDWLDKYIDDGVAAIKAFSADVSQRNREFNVKHAKSSWLAPLNLMESAINETIKMASSQMQHELRCRSIGLKKQVMDDSRANNDENEHLLISKKLFDTFFDDVFYNQLVSVVGQDVFFSQRGEAEQAYSSFEASYVMEKKKQYKEWIGKKLETRRLEELRKSEESAKEEAKRIKRTKQSKCAYKKWVKLHQTDAYYSTCERKAKKVPQNRRADHYQRWTYEAGGRGTHEQQETSLEDGYF